MAGTANAGGFVAPVTAPAIELATPVGDWQGGYVGATLGYAFGGNDALDLHNDDTVPGAVLSPSFDVDLGKFKLKGANAGLRAGYLWQSGKWVYGPELAVEGGSVKDRKTFAIPSLPDVKIESKLRSLVSLKLRGGYEVAPQTLVTAHLGVVEGRFKYEAAQGGDSGAISYSRTGYTLGVGIEHRLGANWSVTGEIERNQFRKKDIGLAPGLHTTARPSFNNVKIGVNYRF